MNYTTNYHLPQWAKEDRIMMEDFNQMCRDLEESLEKIRQTAETLPFATGEYWGLGEERVTIDLGFRPSCVIITNAMTTSNANNIAARTAIACEGALGNRVYFTDTGFELAAFPTTTDVYPYVNQKGGLYRYIAFKDT